MINPANITNYYQTQEQLEESILFWILAAGKNGTRAAQKLEEILLDIELNHRQPFQSIINNTNLNQNTLTKLLLKHKTGAQSIKAYTIIELIKSKINLSTCERIELINIWGIGPKSASCFILHSRPNIRMAGIDRHLLKYLTSLGHIVPKHTPNSLKKYEIIEKIFLSITDDLNLTPAEFDLQIWNSYKK